MTVSNNNVIKAIADFTTADGYHLQNVWHWIAAFASDQTDAAVLAAILTALGNLYDDCAAQMPSTLQDPDVAVDLVGWSGTQWETTQRVGEGIAGTTPTGSADFLPLFCAPYFVMRTARPRSNGRKFMPVFTENEQAGGGLISGAQTALGNALTDALASITISSGNDLVPGVPSTVTGTFLPFLNGFVKAVIGTQRRRRQGYGI